jgi:signal peptidase
MDVPYRKLAGVLVVVAALPFVVFAVPQLVGASHSYVVMSSSMSPAIGAGDVVFVEDVDTDAVEVGDVITFEPESGVLASHGDRVTHRVTAVDEREDGVYFQTAGDANDSPDEVMVPAENVVGRVSFSLPLVGWAIVFAGTRLGIALLVVVPATALATLEVRDLWRSHRSREVTSQTGQTETE